MNKVNYQELLAVPFIEKPTTEDSSLPYLVKPRNVIMIDIEGIDNSGKETFSKTLKTYLEEFFFKSKHLNAYISNDYKSVEIIRESFPRYSTPIGETIANFLRDENLQQENKNWRDLYLYDFYDYLKSIYTKAMNNPEVLHILIMDRGILSNAVYSCLEVFDEEKFINNIKIMSKMILGEESEKHKSISTILSHSVNLIQDFGVFDKLSDSLSKLADVYQRIGGLSDILNVISIRNENKVKVYLENLLNKENRDLNETPYKQLFIAFVYNSVSSPEILNQFTSQITHNIPCHFIEYQSNWNNIKYEHIILNTLLSILK